MTEKTLVQKTVLDNGLRIVTEKIPYVRSVSIGIWIMAGTRDEQEEKNGVAHFVEHMVFKGTETRSSFELAEALESLGGLLNAFTSKEVTCFYAQVLDEHVETAVDILSDIILHHRLSEKDIEKEKSVILEEITELEDTPGELVQEIFIRDIFYPHPLSFSILGTKETVSSLTKKDIQDFIHANYSANRTIVAAAGNLEHDEIVRYAQKYLSEMIPYTERRQTPIPEEKPRKNVIQNNFQQAHICLGRRTFPYKDERRYPLLLLNSILGNGMSSRLFQSIREEHGLAYSVYSFADFLQDTGIFGVYLGTDREKIDTAIELVQKNLQDLIVNSLSDEELQKRKNQVKGNLILGLESTSGRMNRLAKMEIYYQDYIPIDRTISAIEAVNRQQIHEIARQTYGDGQFYITILKPGEPTTSD